MPYDGTGWDPTSPAASDNAGLGDDHIRDLKLAMAARLNKEHVALGAGSAGGEHKEGSAVVYVVATEADLAALTRPDGSTAFTTADEGRLAICLDTGLAYFLKNVTGTMTWTKISSEATAQAPEDYVLMYQTVSGTLTSGDWRDRILNVEEEDAGAICTLDTGTGRFTLGAGTYRYRIDVTGYACGKHQARLYNITSAELVAMGTSENADSTNLVQNRSTIIGRVTIAGSTVFAVQHQCETTKVTNGQGVAASFGPAGTNYYATVEIWKEV